MQSFQTGESLSKSITPVLWAEDPQPLQSCFLFHAISPAHEEGLGHLGFSLSELNTA